LARATAQTVQIGPIFNSLFMGTSLANGSAQDEPMKGGAEMLLESIPIYGAKRF
jgi:hypothetical protein